jgi:hypothetical protein
MAVLNIDSETCGHGNAPAAVVPLHLEGRVALLTSLSFAGLKGMGSDRNHPHRHSWSFPAQTNYITDTTIRGEQLE